MRFIRFLPICILLLASCKTVDIRTPEAKKANSDQSAKSLLTEMKAAHGTDNWSKIEAYSLTLNDRFEGLMGRNGNPYPKNKAKLKLEYIPNTFTGRGTFLEGKWQDRVWGIQSWNTYTQNKNGQYEWDKKNNKDIEFWIPTYQYFIELPLRIGEADVVRYAGKRMHGDQTYDLVYATWKNSDPQKDIDQYMLWINSNTKMLDIMHYTVRDMFNWVHGTIFYKKYTDKGGVKFPIMMDIKVFSPESKKMLHKMSIEDIKIKGVQREALIIDPSLDLIGKH